MYRLPPSIRIPDGGHNPAVDPTCSSETQTIASAFAGLLPLGAPAFCPLAGVLARGTLAYWLRLDDLLVYQPGSGIHDPEDRCKIAKRELGQSHTAIEEQGHE